jgi:hypothetical protein
MDFNGILTTPTVKTEAKMGLVLCPLWNQFYVWQ